MRAFRSLSLFLTHLGRMQSRCQLRMVAEEAEEACLIRWENADHFDRRNPQTAVLTEVACRNGSGCPCPPGGTEVSPPGGWLASRSRRVVEHPPLRRSEILKEITG